MVVDAIAGEHTRHYTQLTLLGQLSVVASKLSTKSYTFTNH
jgi:hypothetical protein